MKEYRVLWIDDQSKSSSFESFKQEATMEGIQLVCRESRESGVNEFKLNQQHYDAVLLDGMIPDRDGGGDLSRRYSIRARSEIKQIDKTIGIFGLTGNSNLINDITYAMGFEEAMENEIEGITKKKVFKKGSDQDTDELFIQIKDSADKRILRQFINSHSDIYNLFSIKGEGISHFDLLLASYEYLHNKRDRFAISNIRDLLDAFFERLKALEVIDRELVTTNDCAHFLRYYSSDRNLNGHWDYTYNEDIFPLGIAGYIFSFQDLLQKGCHEDFYRALENNESYGLMTKGLINQLYFLLNWFGANYEKYSDRIKNRSRWNHKS